jgi:hypothetical protein
MVKKERIVMKLLIAAIAYFFVDCVYAMVNVFSKRCNHYYYGSGNCLWQRCENKFNHAGVHIHGLISWKTGDHWEIED